MFGSSMHHFWHQSVGPLALWQWVFAMAVVLAGTVLGRLLAHGLRLLAMRVVRRTPSVLDNVVVDAVQRPVRVLVSAGTRGDGASMIHA
jgi:hypothetical protein